MHVAILNHAHTIQAIRLKELMALHATVQLIDSGSILTEQQRTEFDVTLPNVYYGGLLSAAINHTSGDDDAPLWIWCSDVSTSDYSLAISRAQAAFLDPSCGVFAPSAHFSGHPQMANKSTGGLRRVTFVEGFCFAARLNLLRELLTEGISQNPLGWGLDRHLGFLACRHKKRVTVDDGLNVSHPRSTGYDTALAANQRDAWLQTRSPTARRFHRWTSPGFSKRRPFVSLLPSLPW